MEQVAIPVKYIPTLYIGTGGGGIGKIYVAFPCMYYEGCDPLLTLQDACQFSERALQPALQKVQALASRKDYYKCHRSRQHQDKAHRAEVTVNHLSTTDFISAVRVKASAIARFKGLFFIHIINIRNTPSNNFLALEDNEAYEEVWQSLLMKFNFSRFEGDQVHVIATLTSFQEGRSLFWNAHKYKDLLVHIFDIADIRAQQLLKNATVTPLVNFTHAAVIATKHSDTLVHSPRGIRQLSTHVVNDTEDIPANCPRQAYQPHWQYENVLPMHIEELSTFIQGFTREFQQNLNQHCPDQHAVLRVQVTWPRAKELFSNLEGMEDYVASVNTVALGLVFYIFSLGVYPY